MALGLAAVEEGDDRLRPALQLFSTLGTDGFLTFNTWGRKYAQVEEQSMWVNIGVRHKLFNMPFFFGNIGAAALRESTIVKAYGNDPKTQNDEGYNFGVCFGIHAERSWDKFYLRGGWDSALFLAGKSGIYLTTARKQAIALTAGVRF